jgi:hypothetical protein
MSGLKLKESASLRWYETPEWTVFLNNRGIPVGFEHATLGDEGGSGGLWFDGTHLVDYDGVYSLPQGVMKICESVGLNMDYAKEVDDSLKLSRKLRKKVLGILHCYYKDMRYHSTITDVSGINAVTNGTPSFDSEEELEAYLDDVHDTIEEFLSVTREND